MCSCATKNYIKYAIDWDDEQNATYHTYRDIERLCRRIDTDILELIDILKDKDTPKIKDGAWTTYKVNGYYIGIQYFKRGKTDK